MARIATTSPIASPINYETIYSAPSVTKNTNLSTDG